MLPWAHDKLNKKKGGDIVKKRSICVLAVLLACLCVLVGCGGAKYHAKLYSKAKSWVDEEFLKENRVYGAAYRNEDYVEGVSDVYDEFFWDETAPRTRTFVIKTKEEYQSIFTKSTVEVDFEKKIVILFTFTDDSPREYKLKNIKLDDQTLCIYYKLRYTSFNDTVEPYQRCFMLVLDITDFETVEFIEK